MIEVKILFTHLSIIYQVLVIDFYIYEFCQKQQNLNTVILFLTYFFRNAKEKTSSISKQRNISKVFSSE